MAKQTIKQRKALRSAAAKKGWDARIARERREIEEARTFAKCVLAKDEAAASPLNWVWVNESECATVVAEPVSRHREMVPNDIESARLRCERVRAEVEREFAATRPPSLFQRIREWFA
jgi:hypothetical protein